MIEEWVTVSAFDYHSLRRLARRDDAPASHRTDQPWHRLPKPFACANQRALHSIRFRCSETRGFGPRLLSLIISEGWPGPKGAVSLKVPVEIVLPCICYGSAFKRARLRASKRRLLSLIRCGRIRRFGVLSLNTGNLLYVC